MIETMLTALSTLLSPGHLLYLGFGVMMGLAVGILPGLGGSTGTAILLPFIFGMDPGKALAMMIGLQSVTVTSDTFPSVLIGVPGTSGSQATVLDGFPLSKKGQAARALGAAFASSMCGGVFGALLLSVAIFGALEIILAIGFGEQMMLIVFALTMVGMLTGPNPWKGFASCGLGLLIGALGSAPVTGIERVTFGTVYLIEPLSLVILGLGMFAMPEILDLLRRQIMISGSGTLGAGWIQGFKDVIKNWFLVLRCASIGSLCGALPGLGNTVIDWIAYGHVIQTSKDRSQFGKGDIRGVIAPESANNAKEGGALIPTILFGIPGSGAMAILLGGFILIGIEPGLNMINEDLDLVFIMFWSVGVANIMGAGICLVFSNQLAKVTTVKNTILAPLVLVLIFFAAFQITRDWADLIALLLCGSLGIYMKRFGWSRPGLLIGFVLSGKVEASIYQTVQVYGFSFLERPIVIILIVFTVLSVIAAARFKPQVGKMSDHGPHTNKKAGLQVLFYLLLVAFSAYVLADGISHSFLTGIYPMTVGVLTLLLMLPVGLQMFFSKKPHTVFYDSEREEFDDEVDPHSTEYYLLWIIGMLAVSALVGFVGGVLVFLYVFLRRFAQLPHWGCALTTGLAIGVLETLAYFLNLEYPQGILQTMLIS